MARKLFSGQIIKVALTGGGTGGHIFPLIAILRELSEMVGKDVFIEPIFFGPDDFSLKVFKKEGIPGKKIISAKFRRYFDLRNIFIPFKLFFGFLQSLWHLYFFMPDILISKGGYGSLPLVLAAFFYRIPILIHESDSVPGLTTIITAKFAKRIGVSFEETLKFFPKKKVFLAGNPIRFKKKPEISQEEAKEKFSLRKDKPLVLFLGGSQGASSLNDFVLNLLPLLIGEEIQVLHQTGDKEFESIKGRARIVLTDFSQEERKLYRPVGFLDERSYALALTAADLVFSRAGSGVIFEIAFFGKPSILVPYPWASRNHQEINALEYSQNKAAVIIKQKNLLPHLVLAEIKKILSSPEKIEEMSQAASNFAKPEAAKIISQEAILLI